MELSQVTLGAVLPEEEARFRAVMGTHHYLGAAPKVGETLWYGALWRGEWVALASFSAAALKCQARDAWIGWTLRHKYDRLHLVANNTRFLLLRPVPNLGSRVLGLCARHLVRDWPARFHHPLVLLETFVDPSRFVGTVYRAAGWTEVGMTRGFRRVRGGYRAGSTPKKVFVRALTRHARRVLCTPTLEPRYRHGRPRTMLSAEQMRSLPDVFRTITDPRSRYGRRYPPRDSAGAGRGGHAVRRPGATRRSTSGCATSRRRCCATSAAAVSTAPTSDRASTVCATRS